MCDSDSGRESPVANYRSRIAAYRHPKLIDHDRNTKLHNFAVTNDTEKIVKYLKRESNVIDPENYMGWTPLMMACRKGRLEAVKCLLDHGANSTKKNRYGMNVFQIAVAGGNLELIKYLLDHMLTGGTSKRLLNLNFPVTAMAILFRKQNVLEFLIEKHFDINGKAPLTGYTPFMLAHALENDAAVATLLKNKVDTTAKNYLGHTAVDIATIRHHMKTFHQEAPTPITQKTSDSNNANRESVNMQNELMNQKLRMMLQVKSDRGGIPTHAPPPSLNTPLPFNAHPFPFIVLSPFPHSPNLIPTPHPMYATSRRSSNIAPYLSPATPNISPVVFQSSGQQVFFPPNFQPNQIMLNVPSESYNHSYHEMLNKKYYSLPEMSPFNVPSPCL